MDTGPGYRVWRQEEHDARHFDVLVGVGYRFEQYDGNTGPDETYKTTDPGCRVPERSVAPSGNAVKHLHLVKTGTKRK